MSDWPPDFDQTDLDEDDIDMGEPVTDKLNVLLAELPDDRDSEEVEADMGEPVTDKLNALLDQLPDDWESEDSDIDFTELVTDKLGILLDELPSPNELPREGFWTRVRRSAERRRMSSDVSPGSPHGLAIAVLEFTKLLFGSIRRIGGGKRHRGGKG